MNKWIIISSNTISGEEVANYAKKLGTDGGFSDFLLEQIKSFDYQIVETTISELLSHDKYLSEYVEASEMRQYEDDFDRYEKGHPKNNYDAYPIVDIKNEVLDGYNRILGHVLNGDETIKIYKAVSENKKTASESLTKAWDDYSIDELDCFNDDLADEEFQGLSGPGAKEYLRYDRENKDKTPRLKQPDEFPMDRRFQQIQKDVV